MKHLFAILLLVLASSGPPAWGMAPTPSTPFLLWEPLSGPIEPDDAAREREPWMRSEQPIRFMPTVLSALRDPASDLPEQVAIRLPDRPELGVAITSRTSGALGTTIVQGRSNHEPAAELFLSIKGEAVVGTVRLGKQVWRIEYRGGGRHRVVELDPERLPRD